MLGISVLEKMLSEPVFLKPANMVLRGVGYCTVIAHGKYVRINQ